MIRVLYNAFYGITIVFSLLYYILRLRKYHNFNGKVNFRQRRSVHVITLFKFMLNILLCFAWVFFRLDREVLTNYPLYLTISDFVQSMAWFSIVFIIYLEWNRSLPHHFSLRIFWFVPVILNAVRYYLFDKSHIGSLKPYEVRRRNSILIVLSLYIILAIFGILGFIPRLKQHIEANIRLAQNKQELAKERSLLESKKKKNKSNNKDEKSTTSLFMATVFSRRTAIWVILGFLFAIARGIIMQIVFVFFGMVFQSTVSYDPETGVCKEEIKDIIGNLSVQVGQLVLIFVAYAGVNGLSNFFLGMASEKIANGTKGIRNKLFSNMIHQEMGYLHGISTGVLVSRFSNDAERVKRTVAELVPQILEWLGQSATGLVILFTASSEVSLYMITILPLTYAISYYQSEIFELYEERNQYRTANMTSKVQDVFSKLATVMIYDKKITEKRQFSRLVNKGYRILCRRAFFSSSIIAVTEFLSWATTSLGLYLATSLLYDFTNLQKYVIYGLVSLHTIRAIVMLLKTVPKIGETLGASHEIMRMMHRKPEPPEGVDDNMVGYLKDLEVTKGEIEFRNVIFAYPGAPHKRVFNNLNLKIPKNSKVAIVGDSGAGKSTILQLIARFYDPQGGSVLIDGQDLMECNTESIRRHMAIVSQDSDIFAMTILENLLYGHTFEDEEEGQKLVNEILDAIISGKEIPQRARGIIDNIMKSVEGAYALEFVEGRLDFKLGEGGKGLSGGQKQRLTIARALYKNPKILLLDEVTSALDQQSEEFVQSAIDRLVQNRTVLIVAHRLHTIQNADKIIVMQKGKITAEGTHNELLQTSQRYRELVEAAKEGKIQEKSSQPLSENMVQLFKKINKRFREHPDLKRKYGKKISAICPDASTKKIVDEELVVLPSQGSIQLKPVNDYMTEEESDLD